MPSKHRTASIRQKVLIPNAKPEEIYKAPLSAKQHSAITGARATCNAKEGARFTAWDGYIIGRNVTLTQGKKIVQEWQTTEWPEGYAPSTLEITLKEQGDATELTLVQSNVPASQVKEYDEGWHESYWIPMKEYFAEKR